MRPLERKEEGGEIMSKSKQDYLERILDQMSAYHEGILSEDELQGIITAIIDEFVYQSGVDSNINKTGTGVEHVADDQKEMMKLALQKELNRIGEQ